MCLCLCVWRAPTRRQMRELQMKHSGLGEVRAKRREGERLERDTMYQDLGWLADDGAQGGGLSSERLGALLKRVRVFKILGEEAAAEAEAEAAEAAKAAAEAGEEVVAEAEYRSDIEVDLDDPRLQAIRCAGGGEGGRGGH